jgi:L,D-transpeptidase catalytic domain
VVPRRALLPLTLALLALLPACRSEPRASADPVGRAGSAVSGRGSDPVASPSPADARVLRAVGQIIDGADGFVVVPHERLVPMWKQPDAGAADFRLDARSPGGGRAPMLVKAARLDPGGAAWLEVYLPIRPNGSTAWVSGADVRVERRHERIEVDLSERILRHFHDGRLVDRFSVGVGQSRFPTGTGTFYVWAKVPFDPPSGAYGVYALGLSGFSPVLSDWPGEGRMAIHGTLDPSDRGQAVSFGCVRVYDPDMVTLEHVPLGTPVIIRA